MEDGIHPQAHDNGTRPVWMEGGTKFCDPSTDVSQYHPTRMFGTSVVPVSEGQSFNAQSANVVTCRNILHVLISTECIVDNECIVIVAMFMMSCVKVPSCIGVILF